MPILKIRNEHGEWVEIPALVGPQGPPGPKGESGDGAGDMLSEVYDADGNGIVDDAQRLGGRLPEAFAAADAIPTKISELENDRGFLIRETDPTVPAWAKAAAKPSYSVSEIGGLSDTLNSVNSSLDSLDAKINLKANVPRHYTATFAVAGWAGDSAPYVQTVAVNGLTVDDMPIVDLAMSDNDTADSADAKLTAWGLIGRIVAGNKTLTAYCYGDAPEAEIPVKLVVF